jgi:hypothetical protein
MSVTVLNGDSQRLLTLKHVFDQDGALCDLFIDDELLVVRSDEKDHGNRAG